MKPAKPLSLFTLLIALTSTPALHASDSATGVSLESAYLEHWFSFDSKEPSNVTLSSLDHDSIGKKSELQFSSDDGQIVNGVIAYPAKERSSIKLALALHPMGSDQNFWWRKKSPLGANKLADKLRNQGYTVISLDARRHGARAVEGFGPRELIKRAHSDEPRSYIDTIIGSVRDYRIILNWAESEIKPEEILVMGYSMGAQMSLLLASYEPSVDVILAMVPPYVGSPTSPVAPRRNVSRIENAKVLWLAGTKDPYSKVDETKATFAQIESADKHIVWFESGHRLPEGAIETALQFFDSIAGRSQK